MGKYGFTSGIDTHSWGTIIGHSWGMMDTHTWVMSNTHIWVMMDNPYMGYDNDIRII